MSTESVMVLKAGSSSQVTPPPLQPWDEQSQRLDWNIHPPDWANPKPAARYNLVVIGAGTAGLVIPLGKPANTGL